VPLPDALSIRGRVVALVAVALLPACGLLAWLLVSGQQQAGRAAQARAQTQAQAQELANAAAQSLGRWWQSTEAAVGRLAERALLQGDAVCDALAAAGVPGHPEIVALSLHDGRGQRVCGDTPPVGQPGLDGVAGGGAPTLRAGGLAASGALIDARTGRRVAVLTHPLGGGAAGGLLAAQVDLAQLAAARLPAALVPVALSVVDASGAIMTAAGDGGRTSAPRLQALAAVPGAGWKVLASLPADEALAAPRDALREGLALGAGLLLLAAVLAWRVGAAIVRPIGRLRAAVASSADTAALADVATVGPPELRAVAQHLRVARQTRAASEERLRGIFDSAVDAIITADEQQLIVQANPSAARLLGCTVGELVGAPLERFIPARYRERHRLEVQAFGEGGERSRHMGAERHVTALRADGTEFTIEATISQVRVDGQRLFTVIHRDVTERRQTLEALLNGKSKLEAALAAMTDAVFISDTEGRFSDVNAAFARFHRFPDLASCRRTLADYPALIEVSLPDGTPVPLEDWAVPRGLRGDVVAHAEYVLRRKDTGERWVGSYSFAPIRGADGSIAGAVVVARDITAIKQAQADLEASHAALQSLITEQDRVQEGERGRIARELHDDLQQSLAAIRIDLGALAEQLRGSFGAAAALVDEIDQLAARAIQSTRRIVNDLRPQMLEDLGLVDALHALATQFAQRTGIACTVDTPGAAADALMVSPALATCLFRVTQEALNNAAKHSQASRVGVRIVVLTTHQVALSIVDNGRGVQPADRAKPGSFGMLGMNERVRAQGGTLRVERLAAGGTLVEAVVPMGGAPAGPAGHGRGPLPRLLGQAARQTLQSVIDALEVAAVVLDRQGVVVLVNGAWHVSAEAHGAPAAREMGPGMNYLAVCLQAAADDPAVQVVHEGLRDVIDGRRSQFSHEYDCHAPLELRWFRLHAAPISSGHVLLTHTLMRREPRPAPGAAGAT